MKKNLLFLFAASALFAACSSDEMPNGNTPGDGEQTIENYASSISMTTEEGIGMSIGALSEADTKALADYNTIYFDVRPAIDDIMNDFKDYVLEADDFYIRKNGVYLDVKRAESSTGGSSYGEEGKEIRIMTTGTDFLTIRVQGLKNIELNPDYNDDYTFEAYMWIKKVNTTYEDGTGAVEDLFTQDQKETWVGGNVSESGIDITKESNGTLTGYPGQEDPDQLSNANEVGSVSGNPNGFDIRYNIYRGISGTPDFDENGDLIAGTLGNTPYIKVSIHVTRHSEDLESTITRIYPTTEE